MNQPTHFERVSAPWVAFPEINPTELSAYLKQGTSEAWFDQVWRPFWNSLNQKERLAYLQHWDASPEWTDAINGVFAELKAFDIDADKNESDVYRSVLRESRASSLMRPWWKRLFNLR